jgi:IS5 family transposase
MSWVLDANPEITELVLADLLRDGADPARGREGMSAETVLRALVVKQMNSFSYEQLAFHLSDSRSYRTFCRLGLADSIPRKSTLQDNIKKLRPETLLAINEVLVHFAEAKGMEDGTRVRTDCTEVESNIHMPTDSSLMWDCVRALVRLLQRASSYVAVSFSDHSRRAKRRDVAINNAKSNADRRPMYRDLMEVTQRTVGYANRAIAALERQFPVEAFEDPSLHALHVDLRETVAITERVVDQTQQRVFEGRSVAAADKVVSIVEPHTAIISKERRETVFGHKVCLTSGASGLVLDCQVERHNPRDSELAVGTIERLIDLYGRPPRQACFDGGFSSKANLSAIRERGVTDIAFSKGPGLAVSDMVRSSWIYRQLKKFRAGVEGTISFLKRCFGLRRCTWHTFESFQAYVLASVVSANLLLIARHALR